MDTDITNSSRDVSPPVQPTREIIGIIRANKRWTVLAFLCVADGVFAIIDIANKPGFLTMCSNPSDLKTCQLSPLGIAHILGWTLVPPVFFFIETLIKRSSFELTGNTTIDASRKLNADRLKAMQEMGGKIWAAVLAAILFLAPK